MDLAWRSGLYAVGMNLSEIGISKPATQAMFFNRTLSRIVPDVPFFPEARSQLLFERIHRALHDCVWF